MIINSEFKLIVTVMFYKLEKQRKDKKILLTLVRKI
jgi:hypothetical protein